MHIRNINDIVQLSLFFFQFYEENAELCIQWGDNQIVFQINPLPRSSSLLRILQLTSEKKLELLEYIHLFESA